jgi:hypothetical protein
LQGIPKQLKSPKTTNPSINTRELKTFAIWKIAYPLLCAVLTLHLNHAIAQTNKISGFVKDSLTHEPLIGASVIGQNQTGVTTDENGFFSIFPKNDQDTTFTISYIGYRRKTFEISQYPINTVHTFYLSSGIEINEIGIIASHINKSKIGALAIPMDQITKLPSITGDADILKAFQLMPGVQVGTEASAGIYVRGGSSDQNLYLLDDVPLYSIDHLGGFLSVFDANSIKNVDLYKGYIPARFGGRLSAVLDVKLRDGSANEKKQQISIGLLASSYFAEGPLSKKSTFMVSLRRCNLDLFMRPLSKMGSSGKMMNAYTFMDFNGKLTKHISPKTKTGTMFYFGRDKILSVNESDDSSPNSTSYRSRFNNTWGNLAYSFNWTHYFDNAATIDIRTGQSTFFYKINEKMSPITASSQNAYGYSAAFKSAVNNFFAKSSFNYKTGQIKTYSGLMLQHQIFNPSSGNITFSDRQNIPPSKQKQTSTVNDLTAYCDIEWKPFDHLTLLAGINSQWCPQINAITIDPRISLLFSTNKHWIFQFDHTYTHQFSHLLTTSGSIFSPDLWIPSTKNIAPEKGKQFNIGITHNRNGFVSSLHVYRKTMYNLITYKPGVSLINTNPWQNAVEKDGFGIAKGIEFLLQKKEGKNTGWIGYTLSKNVRKFDNLNTGQFYPYKYDRRHELKLAFLRQLSDNVSFSSTWVYLSGAPMSLAYEKYNAIDFDNFGDNYNNITYNEVYYYSSTNNYRMRPYHKLDVGFNFTKARKKHERTIYLGVYNVYNQMNGSNYSYKKVDGEIQLQKTTYFPFIPSFSYTAKF